MREDSIEQIAGKIRALRAGPADRRRGRPATTRPIERTGHRGRSAPAPCTGCAAPARLRQN
ncbi:hypothetical protein ACU4GD_23475 [Cupriavidus basilensis]